MAQSEQCVIECDDCGTETIGDDWREMHADLRAEGWQIDSLSDLCPRCA